MVVLRYKRVIGASWWIRGRRPADESRPRSGPRADVNPGSVRWPRLAGHHLLVRCVLHDAQSISARAVAKRLRTNVPSVAVHRPVTSPAPGRTSPSAAGLSRRAKEMVSRWPAAVRTGVA